jgi:hypothetical protein
VWCLAAAACSKDEKARPTPPATDTSGAITINGSERLGWEQRLPANARVEDYGFVAYVDSTRHTLASDCQPGGAADSYTCSAPLPFIATGRHALRLATVRIEGASQIESERTPPLLVVKVAATLTNRVEREDAVPGTIVEVLASGLGPISDLAVDPEGRVFIAAREGRVRIVEQDRLRSDVALVLQDVEVGGGLGLSSIAVAPDFAKSRHVYLAYTGRSTDGPVYKLVRTREVNGQLGETAVLLEEAGAQPGGWMTIRFGADGMLYAALAARRNMPAASYLGKILRVNANGTTPKDHPRATPVAGEVAGVRGLAWLPDGSALIASEVFSPAPLAPAALSIRRLAGFGLSHAGGHRVAWQGSERPAGLSIMRVQGTQGIEVVAGMLDGGVQRFRLGGDRLAPVGGRLLERHGAIRAVAVARAGRIIYAGTANGDARLTAGEHPTDDTLLKVRLPERES